MYFTINSLIFIESLNNFRLLFIIYNFVLLSIQDSLSAVRRWWVMEVFENFQSGFKVTVMSEEISEIGTTPRSKRIFDLIKDNSSVTT